MHDTNDPQPRHSHPNDPLHGVTLKALLQDLVERHGWEGLAEQVPLDCFANQPSLSSSLRFLRRTAWARRKVERFYLDDLHRKERNARRNRRRAAMRAHRQAEDNPPPPVEGQAD